MASKRQLPEDRIDFALGLTGGIIHVVAFIIYNWQVFRGISVPNLTTWSLWVFVSSLNCATFFFSTNKDRSKVLLPFMSSVACICTFVYTLKIGRLSDPKDTEIVIGLLGLGAIAVWGMDARKKPKENSPAARRAYLVMQLATCISFIPTYGSVWVNPATEYWLPWMVWSVAYIFLIINIIRRRNDNFAFIYPVNCLVLHAVVGLLSLR